MQQKKRRRPPRPGSAGLSIVEVSAATGLRPWLDALCQGGTPAAAAYVLRRAIGRPACRQFVANFHQAIRAGGALRQDGFVTAAQVGVTQFGKGATDYLAQSGQAAPLVESLFAGLTAPAREGILLSDWLQQELQARGVGFAAATQAGQDAGLCVARSWQNPGAFSLEPHEDAAQLTTVAAEGFEIARAERVFASIACVESGEGGDLLLWDLVPDEPLRAAFGLSGTGYPYPPDLLDEIPSLRLRLTAGDLAIIDASRIHAVDALRAGSRITVGRFVGRVAHDRVVWWT